MCTELFLSLPIIGSIKDVLIKLPQKNLLAPPADKKKQTLDERTKALKIVLAYDSFSHVLYSRLARKFLNQYFQEEIEQSNALFSEYLQRHRKIIPKEYRETKLRLFVIILFISAFYL